VNRRPYVSRLAVLALLAAVPFVALGQDAAVNILMEGQNEDPVEMKLTLGGDMARMDFAQQVSMVWGPEWMRMIQHEAQVYMEFDKAMLERMRQMMGNMPGAADVESDIQDFDPASMSFERTGATETIMGLEAFEVAFSNDEGQSGSLWMSEDAEVGLFETMSRMMTHLESLAGPMMGGGDTPTSDFRRYMALARAQGLPDGKVLRMDSLDGVRMTMTGYESGPFGDDTWEAPAGYQKQAMPFGN
jgi:hypothetical protein